MGRAESLALCGQRENPEIPRGLDGRKYPREMSPEPPSGSPRWQDIPGKTGTTQQYGVSWTGAQCPGLHSSPRGTHGRDTFPNSTHGRGDTPRDRGIYGTQSEHWSTERPYCARASYCTPTSNGLQKPARYGTTNKRGWNVEATQPQSRHGRRFPYRCRDGDTLGPCYGRITSPIVTWPAIHCDQPADYGRHSP